MPLSNARYAGETGPIADVTCGTKAYKETTLNIIDEINQKSQRSDLPDFRAGDTVKVNVRVTEGGNTRIQVFQGVVIARHGKKQPNATFTVRKVSFGIGVERTFPVNSPTIESLEVVTRGDVRRAKLYYLRERHGKAARIKERRDS